MPPKVGCRTKQGWTDGYCLQHNSPAPQRGRAASWTSPYLFWEQGGPAGCSAPRWGPAQPPLPITHRGAQSHLAPLLILLGGQELLSSVPISLHTSQVLLCQRQVQEVDPRCCSGWDHIRGMEGSPCTPSHCRHTPPILGGCRPSSPLPPDPTLFFQILHSPSHPEAAPRSGHPEGTSSGQPSPARPAP